MKKHMDWEGSIKQSLFIYNIMIMYAESSKASTESRTNDQLCKDCRIRNPIIFPPSGNEQVEFDVKTHCLLH